MILSVTSGGSSTSVFNESAARVKAAFKAFGSSKRLSSTGRLVSTKVSLPTLHSGLFEPFPINLLYHDAFGGSLNAC